VGARLRSVLAGAALLAVATGTIPSTLPAQDAVPERSVAAAGLELRHLDGVKRVLMVAAHPDDEDTSLISALARGQGARVAYLSLSRGEGGQNLIGPELDEGLGIVRTGELLSARRLDGGGQFFGRAFDFGFSKTAEETFRHWPREELLADVVWVIRRFRPQVVVSVFDGENLRGHGQHQAAAIVTYEAFEAAGDPGRFPEQLQGPDGVRPWTPVKLYRSARFDPSEATLEVETGRFDPLLGRSHFQLAMASRSRHRSQDFGTAEPPGPRKTAVALVRSRVSGGEAEGGLFAGVDTALVEQARDLEGEWGREVRESLRRYREEVRRAEEDLNAFRPWTAAQALNRAAREIGAAAASAVKAGAAPHLRALLEERARRVREAALEAGGVVVDVRAAADLVVPGEAIEVDVLLWNGGPFTVSGARAALDLPPSWRLEPLETMEGPGDGFRARLLGEDPGRIVTGAADVDPGSLVRWRYRVEVPGEAELSRLYYLDRPRAGQLYRWPDDRSLWALPRNPPLLSGRVELSLTGAGVGTDEDGGDEAGARLATRRAAEFVGVDPARGQFRRPVFLVPPVSVGLRPGVMAWPSDLSEVRTLSVALEGYREEGVSGEVRLEAPEGWIVEPASASFGFGEPEEGRTVNFSVRPPSGVEGGMHTIRAVVRTERGERYGEDLEIVDYPHILPTPLFDASEARLSVFPVAAARDRRVGYIMGSGDAGADALEQIGLDVTLLSPEAVREGRFDPYDVIVLGVRAYETRPDLVASNRQLLEWVREGGVAIVQYNKYPFSEAGFAPYPVRIHRPHDRVTDEGAPVTVLDPESPVFTMPNRIGPEDWKGWAQERGLYFLGEWDERYTPLLEMNDPGEEAKRGSLVATSLGEGVWVYTGLAFFRQFPEGVPGAYRLLANLVSLDPEAWRDHHGEGGSGR